MKRLLTLQQQTKWSSPQADWSHVVMFPQELHTDPSPHLLLLLHRPPAAHSSVPLSSPFVGWSLMHIIQSWFELFVEGSRKYLADHPQTQRTEGCVTVLFSLEEERVLDKHTTSQDGKTVQKVYSKVQGKICLYGSTTCTLWLALHTKLNVILQFKTLS